MKQFDLDDVFVTSEILDKTGLLLDVKKITEGIKHDKLENITDAKQIGKEAIVTIGLDLMASLMKSLHKARPEVKQLISNLTGKTLDEVGKMSIKEIKNFFSELVKAEGFSDFFKQAVESTE